MGKSDFINRYKSILTALTLGLSMTGCYYEVNGEKHYFVSPSTDSKARVYDPIIYTKEFYDYLSVRGISCDEVELIDTNDNYITLSVAVDSYVVKDNVSIIYLCKKYDMSVSRFIEINSEFADFKEKDVLPFGKRVNIEYNKVLIINKTHIGYKWMEYVVHAGDNVYGYGDGDWNIINIIKDNNGMDDNYTVHLNDVIYVPDSSSVYGVSHDTTEMVVYY